MSYFKAVSITLFSIFIAACDHPIQIVGDGDVTSASGSRYCYLENYRARAANCTKNTVVGAYAETYYATPRAGWKFDKWMNYCTKSKINECRFNTSADVVNQYWGGKVPPLVAVFSRISEPPAPAPATPYGSLKITGGSQQVPGTFAPVERVKGVSFDFRSIWNNVDEVYFNSWALDVWISDSPFSSGARISFGRFGANDYTCEAGIFGSYGNCNGVTVNDNTKTAKFANVRLQAPRSAEVITLNGTLKY